jgi:hypothetical protein
MAKQNNVRNRKKANNKKDKAPDKESKKTTSSPPPPRTKEDDETLSDTFFQHPLVQVAPFVLVPFIFYKILFFLSLKHPEIVNNASLGLLQLRSAVKVTDERQLLVIGAEVAENRYVTTGLGKVIKLEIAHEAFNSEDSFCRDGTVSWFQIMRFLKPLESESVGEFKGMPQIDAWNELCITRSHGLIDLFHPNQYASSNCSSYQKWSPCWAQECLALVNSIWGCAWKDDCPHSFSKIIHQVRHPIHTVDLLNTTICSEEKLKSSFLRLLNGWFPERNWDDLSCLDAMGFYEVDFQNTLIRAREAGLIHGIFQIESTSPCDVAHEAGFLDEFSALYEPTVKRTGELCRGGNPDEDAQSPTMFTKVKEHNKVNTPGLGKLKLEDFNENQALLKELGGLISKLGYDGVGDSEFL